MVLGIECSVVESTSASEMAANHSEKLTNSDDTKIGNNGSPILEEGRNQFEDLEIVNSPPLVVASPSSPSPATIKGTGLKKWRRIRRDVNVDGGGNQDNSKSVKRGLSNIVTYLNKPVIFAAEHKQTSEGSASSSNAMWKSYNPSVDHFGRIADSGFVVGPMLAAGIDSENSEDHSSKSTAASAPKIKNKMKSLGGKKLATSLHKGHQEKLQTDTSNSKKQKGEQIEIEKENSHSSLESDSRTSHFVYGQGNNSATSNGIQCGESIISGEETSDEAQELSEEPQVCSSRNNGEFEVTSTEKYGADCSWAVNDDDKSESNSSPRDLDPLVESIILLQSVQKDLEKEVEKFREIGKEDIIHEEEISGLMESDEFDVQESFDPKGDVANDREDIGFELERLFKQKIEAEVEFLVITKTVQNMRGAVGEHIEILKEQKSKQVNILEKVEDIVKKDEILKGQKGKLDRFYEDIASRDESLKLRSSVWKYASCLLLQLVLFGIILTVLFWKLSPYHADFVPT